MAVSDKCFPPADHPITPSPGEDDGKSIGEDGGLGFSTDGGLPVDDPPPEKRPGLLGGVGRPLLLFVVVPTWPWKLSMSVGRSVRKRPRPARWRAFWLLAGRFLTSTAATSLPELPSTLSLESPKIVSLPVFPTRSASPVLFFASSVARTTSRSVPGITLIVVVSLKRPHHFPPRRRSSPARQDRLQRIIARAARDRRRLFQLAGNVKLERIRPRPQIDRDPLKRSPSRERLAAFSHRRW